MWNMHGFYSCGVITGVGLLASWWWRSRTGCGVKKNRVRTPLEHGWMVSVYACCVSV